MATEEEEGMRLGGGEVVFHRVKKLKELSVKPDV